MIGNAKRKRYRFARWALCACLLASPPALAQEGAQPREIPQGFVLPGPALTNASPGTAPGMAPGARAVAPGASVTSQGGAMAPSQSTVVGPAGATAANPMAYARPAQTGTTNWPCIQRRIETIDPAQVWNGPSLDQAAGTERRDEMRTLVSELALRRIPLGEAQDKAKAFLDTVPEGERRAVAVAIFADLFARLNDERTQVMRGIERYGAKQKALADAIRAENAGLARLRAQSAGTGAALEESVQKVAWDTRIFNERRQSLTFVCEVPTLIEQRLFGLGRTLAAGL